MDVAQFPATEASKGFRYLLLALDGFSRRLFGRVLSDKQAHRRPALCRES